MTPRSNRYRYGARIAIAMFFGLGAYMVQERSNAASLPNTDNPITIENAKEGSPSAEWELPPGSPFPFGDPRLQGFAQAISVNQGETVTFKITSIGAAPYHINIYRM